MSSEVDRPPRHAIAVLVQGLLKFGRRRLHVVTRTSSWHMLSYALASHAGPGHLSLSASMSASPTPPRIAITHWRSSFLFVSHLASWEEHLHRLNWRPLGSQAFSVYGSDPYFLVRKEWVSGAHTGLYTHTRYRSNDIYVALLERDTPIYLDLTRSVRMNILNQLMICDSHLLHVVAHITLRLLICMHHPFFHPMRSHHYHAMTFSLIAPTPDPAFHAPLFHVSDAHAESLLVSPVHGGEAE
jgi:hypothetical protein